MLSSLYLMLEVKSRALCMLGKCSYQLCYIPSSIEILHKSMLSCQMAFGKKSSSWIAMTILCRRYLDFTLYRFYIWHPNIFITVFILQGDCLSVILHEPLLSTCIFQNLREWEMESKPVPFGSTLALLCSRCSLPPSPSADGMENISSPLSNLEGMSPDPTSTSASFSASTHMSSSLFCSW